MVLLYFWGKVLQTQIRRSFAICLFYGFTTGALNTFVYLRMYALLTMLAILSAWLHNRMYNKNFLDIRKEAGGCYCSYSCWHIDTLLFSCAIILHCGRVLHLPGCHQTLEEIFLICREHDFISDTCDIRIPLCFIACPWFCELHSDAVYLAP